MSKLQILGNGRAGRCCVFVAVVAVGALGAHPTPENRALLGELLADDDALVRQAAEEARKRLERLAATPLISATGPPR